MSEAPAGAAGPSSGHPAATDELPRPSDAVPVLSPDDLLRILSDPEYFGLATGVWYAINASDALVESHAEHTLAGRMGLSAETLKELADATGLGKRAATVTKMLKATRRRPGHLALSLERTWRGSEQFRYVLRPQNPTEWLTTQQNHAHAAKRESRPRRSRVPSSSAARLDRPR